LRDLEPDISKQEVEERGPNEVSQYHGDEHGISHSSSKEDEGVVEELEPEQDDEVSICATPSDETIQSLFPLHKKKRMRLVTFLFRILIMPSFMI
jgi:hypothetical protein